MSEVKRIICLANSRKLSARCVAGIELDGSRKMGWIRPVSALPTGELYDSQIRYEDRTDPNVLDLVDVPLQEPKPLDHQRENWLIAQGHKWTRVGHESSRVCADLADAPTRLWVNGDSTSKGLNDRILFAQASVLSNSLYLIHIDELLISIFDTVDSNGRPKRRIQGRFTYNSEKYWLWITDPIYEDAFKSKTSTDHAIGPCYLTISLGEQYKGDCYKLIAAIIQPEGRLGI